MLLRSMLIAGLVGAVVALVPGEVQAAKGSKKHHGIHGVIESVSSEKGKGTLVVKVHHHKKKKKAASGPSEKKVHFGPNTKVEVKHGKKVTPGSLSELRKGEHVHIEEKGDHAEKIVIHHHGKKGKKKKVNI